MIMILKEDSLLLYLISENNIDTDGDYDDNVDEST